MNRRPLGEYLPDGTSVDAHGRPTTIDLKHTAPVAPNDRQAAAYGGYFRPKPNAWDWLFTAILLLGVVGTGTAVVVKMISEDRMEQAKQHQP